MPGKKDVHVKEGREQAHEDVYVAIRDASMRRRRVEDQAGACAVTSIPRI